MNRFLFLLTVVLAPVFVKAQILPKEGSDLNYRLVGFSFPKNKTKSKYKIEIAKGMHKTTAAFKKNITQVLYASENKMMAEVPEWGEEYTWHVVYDSVNKKESLLYHFTTQKNDRIDTTKYRLRVTQSTTNYNDMYVAIDAGGVFYDMNGNAVACLRETPALGGFVADMDFTKDGTITFTYITSAYEVNLNGDVLWQTPEYNSVNPGEKDIYHHNFVKMSNGHYMVLGMEHVPSKTVIKNGAPYIELSNQKEITDGYVKGVYGTIMELDKDGKVVWYWKDTKGLVGTDFDFFTPPASSTLKYDPHVNSFYFDEQNGYVYLCYRNLSRISKIDYRTGKTVDFFGENFNPAFKSKGYGMLCNPHGVKRSQNGEIFFFNNNSCQLTDSLPSVVIFREPSGPDDSLKVVWEYKCTMEDTRYAKRFVAGGSVLELSNGAMYVCMGNEYSKIFIVDRNKKVHWSAVPERHVETDNIWVGVKQYRTNYIDRKGLERMIWDAEIALQPQKK